MFCSSAPVLPPVTLRMMEPPQKRPRTLECRDPGTPGPRASNYPGPQGIGAPASHGVVYRHDTPRPKFFQAFATTCTCRKSPASTVHEEIHFSKNCTHNHPQCFAQRMCGARALVAKMAIKASPSLPGARAGPKRKNGGGSMSRQKIM